MYHSDEVEQMAWDSILLKGWSKEPIMGILLDMYCIDYPDVDLWLLRRFPRKWELNTPAKVFVARYIPKLSDKLWNGDKDIQFWLMMNGDTCNRQKDPADKWATRADTRERVQSRSNVRKKEKSRAAVHNLYSSYRRSNQWSVCK